MLAVAADSLCWVHLDLRYGHTDVMTLLLEAGIVLEEQATRV